MIRNKIIQLKNFILQHNTYFDNGYAEVYKAADTGIVAEGDKIFPTDNKGSFFYLRQPDSIRFIQDAQYAMADGIPGIATALDIVLVAYVPDGDSDKLAQNIVYTLQNFFEGSIVFTSAIVNPPQVLINEMSGVDAKVLNTALQNYDSRAALVSLSFTYTEPFINKPLKCITDPCIC